MPRGKRDGLLIVGGGLAGSLAALAMAKLRPEVPILLIEESDRFGGNHIWSFLDVELEEEKRWLVDPLITLSWPGYYVAFPDYSRKLRLGINSIRSEQLDEAVREALQPDQYRLNTRVVAVRENEVVLPGGERIRADGAIDARGAAAFSMLRLGWRKFVGREYSFPRPHRVDLPVVVDATVEQMEGFRFVYCIPVSENRLLIEDSYYSDTPDLDAPALGKRIEGYMKLRGWRRGRLEREESGVLPVALSDDVHALWRGGGARVAKLGIRGGFFHPTTGYSLPMAVRNALLLAEQRNFDGEILHDLFEAEATQTWKKLDFYRSFNEALFEAPVWERRKIMDSFYHLDTDVIARFFALKLGMVDRMRLSSVKAVKTG
jgi:lycopene beta-cyclase